jgi:hypothetical protein
MKTTNPKKIVARPRFAACAAGARLLSINARAARRAPASESVSPVQLSAGGFSRDGITHGPQNNINLTRCEIFRGKVSLRQIKTKTHLEPRTHLRQNYE